MTSPKILLGVFIFLTSMGAAFYAGLRVNTQSQSPAQVTEFPSTGSSPARQSAHDASAGFTRDTAASLMEMSQQDLGEALRQSDALSAGDQRALLEEAFALPTNDHRRNRMIRTLLSQLAETSPRDALAMAENIGSLRESTQARIEILEVWAKNDPAAAMAWAATELANEPLRSQSSQLLAIFRGYAESNPQAAFAAAMDLPTGNRTERRTQAAALGAVISAQIENGALSDARMQVEQLEDGATKNRLLAELVNEWAAFDPQGAASYLDSLGDAVPASVTTSFLSEWAANDPQAAAAWLGSRELDDRTLSGASTAIIREWTRYDMAASAEWLNSQPVSPALDRAVMSYTYRAAQEDPASAMSWAESINHDQMRTRMMQYVAGTWREDDPESFQDFIDNSDFTDEQRTSLMESRGGRGFGRRR